MGPHPIAVNASNSKSRIGQSAALGIVDGSQAGGGAAAAETRLAGGIFRDVPFEFLAPDRLPGAAASVQGIGSGKIGVSAAQVAKPNPAGGHAGVGLFRFLGHGEMRCRKARSLPSRPVL